MSNLQVANTIRDQIGGRALFMLGAQHLIALEQALCFQIRGSKKGNQLKIELAGDDTYTIILSRYRAAKVTVIQKLEGIYVDRLHETIEEMTGLRTSL